MGFGNRHAKSLASKRDTTDGHEPDECVISEPTAVDPSAVWSGSETAARNAITAGPQNGTSQYRPPSYLGSIKLAQVRWSNEPRRPTDSSCLHHDTVTPDP